MALVTGTSAAAAAATVADSVDVEAFGSGVATGQAESEGTDRRHQREDSPAILAMLWVGFFLVHGACWSLIGMARRANFAAGLAMDVAYLVFLIFLAGAVGRTHWFAFFTSAIWILACTSLFALGLDVARLLEESYGREIEEYGGGFVLTVLATAMLPMLLVALLVMVRSGVMGTFVNLYYGLLYTGLLLLDLPRRNFPGLLQIFFRYEDLALTFFAATYLLVVLVSLFFTLKGRLQDLRPWVAACSLVPIWLLLHQRNGGLSMIYSPSYGVQIAALRAFVLYCIGTLVQLALAVVVDEFVPMVLAGISLLVVAIQGSTMAGNAAWKAVIDSTEAGDQPAYGRAYVLSEVAMFGTMAVLGAAVLLAAIVFAFRLQSVEEAVRAGKQRLQQRVRSMAGKEAGAGTAEGVAEASQTGSARE